MQTLIVESNEQLMLTLKEIGCNCRLDLKEVMSGWEVDGYRLLGHCIGRQKIHLKMMWYVKTWMC